MESKGPNIFKAKNDIRRSIWPLLIAILVQIAVFLQPDLIMPAIATDENPAETKAIETMTIEYNSGQYSTAVEAAHRILEKDPANVTVHYILANIFMRSGQLQQALADYRYCATSFANSPEGRYSKEAIPSLEATLARQANAQNAMQTQTNNVPQHNTQTEEIKDRLAKELQTHLDDRRRTLEVEIRSLRKQAQADIASVPREFDYGNGFVVPNADYDPSVRHINAKVETKIQALRTDDTKESTKITDYYTGLASSYDKTYNNLDARKSAPLTPGTH